MAKDTAKSVLNPYVKTVIPQIRKLRRRCLNCKKTTVKKRPDITDKVTFKQFKKWVLGKLSVSEIAPDISRMGFYERIKKFWDIEPKFVGENKVYSLIIVDGIRVGDASVLIAIDENLKLINYSFAESETANSWGKL
jgi:hypothetical protein